MKDIKNNEKREDNSTREKLSLSIGQVFNYEKNKENWHFKFSNLG